MGLLTDNLRVGLATRSDAARIVEFLNQHWRSNHVFVTNPELMRWQHEFPGRSEDALTFCLADRFHHDGSRALLGLIGFIPFRRYDPRMAWSEMALAIWKVRDDAGIPGLGIMLHNALIHRFSPSLVCAIGISDMVRPIYRALGYVVAEMSHAALFPAGSISPPRVSSGVPDEAYCELHTDTEVSLVSANYSKDGDQRLLDLLDELGAAGAPRKSAQYIRLRFLDHPCYDYSVKIVRVGKTPRAALVWRRVSTHLGAVLRIVDIIGDAEVLARCGNALRSELAFSGCEYVDLVHYGVCPEALRTGGFVAVGDYPALVLPNYFAPFVHRNVAIGIAFKSGGELAGRKVRLFRADSDQDRPNDAASAVIRTRR
jgi:hypothetical protein